MAGHTVIVGAGPGGLAVAASLGRRGAPYTLLERSDTIAASWRHRYDGLRLHTIRWLSALPGAAIPARYGPWVSRDDLLTYLDAYAARFGVVAELGVEVHRIARDPAGWRVETSAGPRYADSVVVATGYSRTPYVPDWPGLTSYPGSFLHSSSYREPSAYQGRQVLVVGAGNSAAEIAVELAAAGAEVELSVRTPPNIVRRDLHGLPSQLFGIALRRAPEWVLNPLTALLRRFTVPDLSAYGMPAPDRDGFSQFLRSRTVPILDHGFVDAIRAGRVHVVPRIRRIQGPQIELEDGRVLTPDAVIAATGYRPDLAPLVGDLGVLDATGLPRVGGAHTVPEAPGLYFVGIDVELSGLLREITREARRVAERVVSV